MNHSKFTTFTLLILLFAFAVPIVQAQHWRVRDEDPAGTMSVLIEEVVIGEEELVEGDEVAVFTPDGFLGEIGRASCRERV